MSAIELATIVEGLCGHRLPDDVRDGLNQGVHHTLEAAEARNDKRAFYRLVVDGWEPLAIFHVERCALPFPNWRAWYQDFLVEGSELYFQPPTGLTVPQIERYGVSSA